MTTAVRVSDDLAREARIYSKLDKRSITGQIEHWARIGKCAEESPDLTYSLISDHAQWTWSLIRIGPHENYYRYMKNYFKTM